jgi:biotin transport system substrate-specific component
MEIVRGYKNVRYNLFRRRYESNFVYKMLFALTIACLTGLAAQLRFHLPWSPVPVTAQTFVVLLSGILLGRRYGGLSQAIYGGVGLVCLSLFGASWFTGNVISTGGYIIGFIPAALFLGYFTDKHIGSRDFLPMLALMLFANFVLIHGPGLLWLGLVSSVTDIPELLIMGTLPFIPGDVTKAVAAAAVAKGIMPKEEIYMLKTER